jgi:adenylate cyclase class 2
MFEVEVKGQHRMSADEVARRLTENGFAFNEPLFQDDTVYARQVSDITECHPGASVARIRTEGPRSLMNVKTYTETPLTKIEHETIVAQPMEAAAILEALGLKAIIRIQKWRQLGVKSNVTVCVDEVIDLGSFVEFELLYRDPPPASAQDDLYQMAIGLLPGLIRVFRGYDELALARQAAHGPHPGELTRPP